MTIKSDTVQCFQNIIQPKYQETKQTLTNEYQLKE